MLEANLRHIKGYNVIDDFRPSTGTATSIKTLDLGASTYLKTGNPVFSKLKGYINTLAKFEGVLKGGVNTTGGAIKKKVLEVGVLRYATTAQIAQINKAIRYAESKGVQMIVRVVK